jgi:hypothetical protein
MEKRALAAGITERKYRHLWHGNQGDPASEGITGPVTRLLSLAAVAAIKSAAERIDEAAIEHVASRLEKDAS